MPCWYYDKSELRETPSILDGITFDTERRYRKEGARFIMTCGTQMGLGHNTMATGVVYFHRFYMFHSFKSFPRYVTACCCLFLAGKVEETPKKCRDIIKTARGLLTDNYFCSFGDDPKEEVMTLERILLQTIKFDLQVEHPYTFLLKYAKCFKGDQQKLQKMVQMAWNFVNDSLSTVVCLQWEPEIIAVALIHLASKLSKFTVVDWIGRQPHHTRWWDMFVADVTMEILEDICHQVLDLYQAKAVVETNSPPQKPPSRADSPTAIKSMLPINPNNGSPAGKSKPAAVAQPPAPTTTAATPAVINSAGIVGEINNIQAIKSLASATPNVPPTAIEHIPPTPAAAGYGMYHAPPPPVVNAAPPPPMHAHPPMYSAHGPAVGAAPPPPQAPLAPYPPPHAANAWVQQPQGPPAHYGPAPPLPPPPNAGGSGGYYAPPPGTYGPGGSGGVGVPGHGGRQHQQRYQ